MTVQEFSALFFSFCDAEVFTTSGGTESVIRVEKFAGCSENVGLAIAQNLWRHRVGNALR